MLSRNHRRAEDMFAKRLRSVLVTWSAVATLAVAAPAVAAGRFAAGAPELESQRPVVQWTMTALFAVGCLAIAFKNSRRSRLD
jgi:hypothetical protein